MNMNLISSARPLSANSGSSVEHLRTAIIELHQQLEDLPDVQPCPATNALFSALVEVVVSAPDHIASDVMRDRRVRAVASRVRQLCAEGEVALEHEWTRRITAHPRPNDELRRFPYLENYEQLIRMEVGMLASVLRVGTPSVAFLGCGPLPLSAIMLARALDARIHIVDRDAQALGAANRLTTALGVDTLLPCHADACTLTVADHDAVILAAMAGLPADEKSHILHHLSASMAPGAILLARSTRGVRTLLYPPVAAKDLCGFDVVNVVHPVNDVINSVVVARARGR